MKIRFGTPLTQYHVFGIFLLGCLTFVIGGFSGYLQSLLGDAEKSILHSRGLNVTDTSSLYFCDLPYDDCLCSVLTNKSENLDNCISYYQLAGSRLLPLISFFLQIFLVRELFSFSADCPHFIRNALWTISLFIFIGMIISIYRNSCYHAQIVGTLVWTGGIIWFLTVYKFTGDLESIESSSQSNTAVFTDIQKRYGNVRIAWQELP